MKKVVRVLAGDEVSVKEVTNSSFVGIMFTGEGYKSWVALTKNGYQGMSIGEQDMCSHWSSKSKGDYVSIALGIEAKVFLFESHRELINWLKS